jgi:hypothetical protein
MFFKGKAQLLEELAIAKGTIVGLEHKLAAEKTRNDCLLERGSRYYNHAQDAQVRMDKAYGELHRVFESLLKLIHSPDDLKTFKEAIESLRKK